MTQKQFWALIIGFSAFFLSQVLVWGAYGVYCLAKGY